MTAHNSIFYVCPLTKCIFMTLVIYLTPEYFRSQTLVIFHSICCTQFTTCCHVKHQPFKNNMTLVPCTELARIFKMSVMGPLLMETKQTVCQRCGSNWKIGDQNAQFEGQGIMYICCSCNTKLCSWEQKKKAR